MRSTAGRVERLEHVAGLGGGGELCACPTMNRDMRVYTPEPGEDSGHAQADADDHPPEVCGRCGRPKQVIKFVVVYAQAGSGA